MIQFDEHIFHMGWNHQPENLLTTPYNCPRKLQHTRRGRYSLLVKVAPGAFERCVETTLETCTDN